MSITSTEWSGRQNEISLFIDEAKKAGSNDHFNSEWRRTVSIRGATDNLSDDFARTCWNIAIELRHDDILKNMDRLRDVDKIMRPASMVDVGEYSISNGLTKYILRAAELDFLFDINGKEIVEIGGGWGGLAAVIHILFKPSKYTIYDIPEVMAAQKRSLIRMGFPDVVFGNDWNAQTGDLLVSDWAFSELTENGQEGYGKRFNEFPNAAMMCQVYHYTKQITPEKMVEKLDAWSGQSVVWGPLDKHYLETAFKHGDPRLMDAYYWRKR